MFKNHLCPSYSSLSTLLLNIIILLARKSFQTNQPNRLITYEFFEKEFTSYSGWNINPTINEAFSDCGKYGRVFGGFDKFGDKVSVYRTYDLPQISHYSVEINLNFLKIDSWDSEDLVFIYVNDILTETVKSSIQDGPSNECGEKAYQNWNEKLMPFIIEMNLSGSSKYSLSLWFKTDFNGIKDEFWGIRDLVIYLKLCDTSCATCNSGSITSCLSCYTNAILSDGSCKCREYYYLKDTESESCISNPCSKCERCHISCKTCNGPYFNNCLSCEKEDKYDETLKTCTYPENALIMAQEFIGFNFDEHNTNYWTLQPYRAEGSRTTICGPYKIVGGSGIFGSGSYAETEFQDLSPHYLARLRMMFLKIDSWDNEILSIKADNIILKTESFSYNQADPTGSICGKANYVTWTEVERTYSITFYHNTVNLSIYITTNLNEDANNEAWGFSQFELVIYVCYEACSTCSGPDLNQCLTCVSNYYYNNGECLKCHSSCTTCFGVSQTNCKTCGVNNWLVISVIDSNQTCEAECPIKTFKVDGQVCKACHIECLTCDGKESNDCLSCGGDINKYFYKNECLVACPPNFFYDSIIYFMCMPCKNICLQCQGYLDYCLECKSGYYLKGSTCLESLECINAFGYPDFNLKKCLECHKTCLKCLGGITALNCSECSYPLYLLNGQCIEDCSPFNHYNDKSKAICVPCDGSCDNCTGPGEKNCLKCKSNFYSHAIDSKLIACLTECSLVEREQNEYPEKYCFDCDKICQDCNGPTASDCTQCKSPYYLYKNECIKDCSIHSSYGDNDYYICRTCYKGCSTCFGPAHYECLSCEEGYYYLKKGEKQYCRKFCPSVGFYSSPFPNNECRPCNINCLSCFGPSTGECNSCVNNLQFSGNQCICGKREYLDRAGICKACHKNCFECDGSEENSCLTCFSPKIVISKKCSCPPGYYNSIQGTCLNCHYSCQLCIDDTDKCIKCKGDRIFDKTGSKCICPQYKYDSQAENCQSCHFTCSYCVGGTKYDCVPGECFVTRIYDYQEKTCSCPSDTFEFNVPECQKTTLMGCHYSCYNCGKNPKDCKSCALKSRRNFDESANRCPCPSGTFDDGLVPECKDCHFTCRDCSGPSYSDCLSCKSNRGKNSKPYYGVCQCLGKTVDDNINEFCDDEMVVSIKARISQEYTFFACLIFFLPLILGGRQKHWFKFIENMQLLNLMVYLNINQGYNLDEFFRVLNQANFTFIPNVLKSLMEMAGFIKFESLDSGDIIVLDQKAPTKFTLNNVSSSFLINAGNLVLINFGVWVLYFITHVLRLYYIMESNNPIMNIYDLCKWSLVIRIHSLTFTPVVLYAILQYKNFSTTTVFNLFSGIIGIALSWYHFSLLLGLIYVVNITLDRKDIGENEKERLYGSLFDFIDIDSTKIIRNFTVLRLLKKLLITLILVNFYDSEDFQVIAIGLIYVFSVILIAALRPNNEIKYRVFDMTFYILIGLNHFTFHAYKIALKNKSYDAAEKWSLVGLILFLSNFVICLSFFIISSLLEIKMSINYFKGMLKRGISCQMKRKNNPGRRNINILRSLLLKIKSLFKKKNRGHRNNSAKQNSKIVRKPIGFETPNEPGKNKIFQLVSNLADPGPVPFEKNEVNELILPSISKTQGVSFVLDIENFKTNGLPMNTHGLNLYGETVSSSRKLKKTPENMDDIDKYLNEQIDHPLEFERTKVEEKIIELEISDNKSKLRDDTLPTFDIKSLFATFPSKIGDMSLKLDELEKGNVKQEQMPPENTVSRKKKNKKGKKHPIASSKNKL